MFAKVYIIQKKSSHCVLVNYLQNELNKNGASSYLKEWNIEMFVFPCQYSNFFFSEINPWNQRAISKRIQKRLLNKHCSCVNNYKKNRSSPKKFNYII